MSCGTLYQPECSKRNDSWDRSLTLLWQHDDSPYDITGASARMQIRKHANDPSPWITLTSAPSGGITVLGPEGILDIKIAADVLDQEGRWVYDVQLTEADSTKSTLVYGPFVISEDVTDG